MKTKTLTLIVVFTFGFLITDQIIQAIAQTNLVSTNGVPSTSPQIDAISNLLGINPLYALALVPLVTSIVQQFKKWFPIIPNEAFPLLVPVAGGLIDWLASHTSLWHGTGAAGAAIGAASVWFHQSGKQLYALVKQGPTYETKPVATKQPDGTPADKS